MAFARLWALATILFMCKRGDIPLDTVIPRSTQEFTTGNILPSILNCKVLSSKTLPTQSTQHFFGEILNCHSLSDIDIQQLITLLRKNNFQRNLVIALAIYWELSLQNLIQIHLYLTFLLHDIQGVTFFWTQCIN